jgi:hypothetical protein
MEELECHHNVYILRSGLFVIHFDLSKEKKNGSENDKQSKQLRKIFKEGIEASKHV